MEIPRGLHISIPNFYLRENLNFTRNTRGGEGKAKSHLWERCSPLSFYHKILTDHFAHVISSQQSVVIHAVYVMIIDLKQAQKARGWGTLDIFR